MSGDRTTPRYDVIATTRRSWSREQKRAIIAEIDVGGATVSQVARRHGMHASLLFRWRRDLGSAFEHPPTEASAMAAPSFMPVMLAAPARLEPAVNVAAHPVSIEIVIAGGRIVRVGADVDTAALARIVAALEATR